MKRRITKLIFSKITFFIITTSAIVGLNLTPLITHILHSPSGRTFAMVHNNAQDFFFYQALMNQGANGAVLISDPYTTEPHQPSVIFSYFAWMGKLGKLLGLPYVFAYHGTRILFGIAFLLASFCLILYFRIPHPRLAYAFFLFAAPLMHKVSDGQKITDLPYMYWWTGIDPIRRVAYLPHHMFGSFLLVLSLILIVRYLSESQTNTIIWTTLLTVPLAFVHPPSLFIILLVLPPAIIAYLICSYVGGKKKSLVIPSQYLYLLGYWVIGLLVLFLMVSQTNRGFPWSQYLTWEKGQQFPLDKELVGAFGILFPLSVIGIVRAVLSRRFSWILTASWLAIPLILIPFAPILQISNIRLIQGAPFLPLAILSVLGITLLSECIQSGTIGKKCAVLFSKHRHTFQIQHLIMIVTLTIFILFSYPALSFSLKDQIREYWPIFGNIYLDNRLYNAFAFINDNFPQKTVTLSTFYTGNYLPAFTHTTSFIGHFGYTYNVDGKQPDVYKFFQGKMKEEEVKEYVLNNKIDLVVQGPEEKPIYNSYLYPQVLKTVYDREEMTLYVLK